MFGIPAIPRTVYPTEIILSKENKFCLNKIGAIIKHRDSVYFRVGRISHLVEGMRVCKNNIKRMNNIIILFSDGYDWVIIDGHDILAKAVEVGIPYTLVRFISTAELELCRK